MICVIAKAFKELTPKGKIVLDFTENTSIDYTGSIQTEKLREFQQCIQPKIFALVNKKIYKMVVLTSFTQPTDGIRHRQNNTTVYVNDNNIGKGTLYIAESSLSWVSDSGNGFSIEYPNISLHAVSRDLSAFPQECLFLMLDTALGGEETKNGDGEDNESGSDDQDTTEIRLVPDDRGMLDAMFHAMNACQALHPDPEDSFSDEDFFEDAEYADDDDNNDVSMEETHSQMANLQIESMDERRRMLGRGVCTEEMEDTVGGREEVGMKHISEGMVGGRGAGMGVGMIRISEGMVGGRGAGMGVGMLRISEDRGVDRVGGILEGRGVDRVVDRVVGTLEGRGVDRVGGTLEGRAVDRVGDRAGDILEGRGVDRVGGILGRGGILADMEGDTEEDMEEDSISASDMAQDGRSFSLGNMRRPGRTAGIPAAHLPRMDLEEDSSFVDAEN